jgi:hypothetical protein
MHYSIISAVHIDHIKLLRNLTSLSIIHCTATLNQWNDLFAHINTLPNFYEISLEYVMESPHIFNVLYQNTTIKSLLINNMCLTVNMHSMWKWVLKNQMTSLRFNGCCCTDISRPTNFPEYIGNNNWIEKIQLGVTNWTKKLHNINYLLHSVLTMPNLWYLDISKWTLTELRMKTLCVILSETNISTLLVKETGLDDNSMVPLGHWLEMSDCKLEHVFLCSNSITNQGCYTLSKGLSKNLRLKSLHIKHNIAVDNIGITEMVRALLFHRSIEAMEFDINQMFYVVTNWLFQLNKPYVRIIVNMLHGHIMLVELLRELINYL